MMRQTILENTKRQTPTMTFVFVLKQEMISHLLFDYVTFSPSRSVRRETNKPPAMRVRVEGYTKKTPNAIQ